MSQQQQQQYSSADDMDQDDQQQHQQGGGGGYEQERQITVQDLIAYSLRNYVFSLIGDMTSKLFIAPVERVNVLYQTEPEVPGRTLPRGAGPASRLLVNDLGNTIWTGLVMQFWRTTFRSFTSTAFYILEPQAGPIIANPTYFFYVRPVVIDLLNLLCVYPVDTAATLAMADEAEQPALRWSGSTLVQHVLFNPRKSLRGFGVTALGLVAYRGSLAAATNFLVNNELIPHSTLNRFLLQNGVLFACTALVYPFDTIRRRLIVRREFKNARNKNVSEDSSSSSSSASAVDETEGSIACAKRIYREEGVGGFFIGINVRMTRMLGGALFYGFIQYLEMQSAAAN